MTINLGVMVAQNVGAPQKFRVRRVFGCKV